MSANGGERIPTTTFASIDSALQSGLRDPRERVALWRLEQAMVDFMTSDHGWMEVGGPANSLVLLPHKNPPAAVVSNVYQSSFHRLLVHRLSDRFGIIREKGSILENSLRLIKVPESRVPETLLRDLDPASYAAGTNTDGTAVPSPSANNKPSPILARSDSSGAGGGGKPRKLKIMKRQTSQPMKASSSGGGGNGRREGRRIASSSDLESREKAYAEARARIFSDGSVEEAKSISTSSQNGGEADDSIGTSGHGLAQAVASRLSLSESSTNSATPATPQRALAHTDPSMTPDQPRAVYRNRAEEAADPDFQRGTAAVVFQQNNMYYGTTPSAQHYGYASAVAGAAPAMRGPNNNNLTATAPAFYPGSSAPAPYMPYPVGGAWQPQAQAVQRPSGRTDQE